MDTPTGNQRDVSHATGYFTVYSSDGTYKKLASGSFGEETGTPQGNHLVWNLALTATDLAKGKEVNLINSAWRLGNYDGGRIYTATGLRPVGFLPPSLETIKATVDPKSEYADGCVETAYALAIDSWFNNTTSKRFGGMTITYANWGTGVLQDSTYTGTDFVWSHETGSFNVAQSSDGTTLGTVVQGEDPIDFFNTNGTGVIKTGNAAGTDFGKQVTFQDGIW